MGPRVHIKKLISFSLNCNSPTCLTPKDSFMNHQWFEIKIFITKVQLEWGVLEYSNLQEKCWGSAFPSISMSNHGSVLEHSCSLMYDIAKPYAPWGQHILKLYSDSELGRIYSWAFIDRKWNRFFRFKTETLYWQYVHMMCMTNVHLPPMNNNE